MIKRRKYSLPVPPRATGHQISHGKKIHSHLWLAATLSNQAPVSTLVSHSSGELLRAHGNRGGCQPASLAASDAACSTPIEFRQDRRWGAYLRLVSRLPTPSSAFFLIDMQNGNE